MELVNKIKTISTQMKEILKPKSDTMVLSNRQIGIILDCFDDIAETTSTSYIIKTLRDEGFKEPEKVVRDALLEGLLYVDSIELKINDYQDMMLALDEWGESLWS